MFHKVLVANRGEIAVRVMRACEELGVNTVAVYSDADRDAGHVRYADEAYNVGPANPTESYLDGDAIIDAAMRAGAEAIHPGYGFLAEKSDFAAKVEDSGLTWIGPDSAAMQQLGEKTAARSVMQAADVPIVPGTTDPVEDVSAVEAFAEEAGYPIAIKAEGGGGGRGMKVVREPSEIEAALADAKREGQAYFDNPSVYLERYLDSPRHIEIQILADHHGNVLHLGERDCSLQRRHQKIIEEAPSPALDQQLRSAIGDAARRGVREAGYTNAGTVEFLVDGEEFYFLEVNTRIQVEHTVTEAITGIDIVKAQIRIAAEEELALDQSDIEWDGHAIEFRINAENPAEGFASTPGRLRTYDPPGGIGVRLDDAVRSGDEIAGEYDSMFAKLVVWGRDRSECIARSERALREFHISGFHTTIPFHRLMLADGTFVDGEHTTDYLDEELDQQRLIDAVETWGPGEAPSEAAEEDRPPGRSYTVEVNGKRFSVDLHPDEHYVESTDASVASRGGSGGSDAGTDGAAERANIEVPEGGEVVAAEMQGSILSVEVEPGMTVEAGDLLCVLEAMKMENDVTAERGGTVASVAVSPGDSVDMGDTLVVLE